MGRITPPVGMNLFAVEGTRTNGAPVADIIEGAIPYAVIMILFALLLIAVLRIATWLPQAMRGGG